MRDIKNIKSTFLFKGEKYRAGFISVNEKFKPLIEKLVFSFLGLKIWKKLEICDGERYNGIDLSNIEKKETIEIVKKLRVFAQISINPCIV